MEHIITSVQIYRGCLRGYGFQSRVRVNHAGRGKKPQVGNTLQAHTTIVPRDVFHQPFTLGVYTSVNNFTPSRILIRYSCFV